MGCQLIHVAEQAVQHARNDRCVAAPRNDGLRCSDISLDVSPHFRYDRSYRISLIEGRIPDAI
jgi:hypothetical protein